MQLQINEREITPISFWKPSGTIMPNIIRVDNFQNYFFDGGDGHVHWVLLLGEDIPAVEAVAATDTTPAIEAKEAYTAKKPITNGNVTIPAEILSQWGADDSIIFNYVIEQINVQEKV